MLVDGGSVIEAGQGLGAANRVPEESPEHVPQELNDFCDENMLQPIESRAFSCRSDGSIRSEKALGNAPSDGIRPVEVAGISVDA
ncbi:MAG TPA: hypothetical protein VIQ29_20135 [Ancylobacter sp.]